MGTIDDFFAQIENKHLFKQQRINNVNNSINTSLQQVNNQENNDIIDSFLSEVQISQQSQMPQKKKIMIYCRI
jgi:rhodanese-related sulfurtransferase